MEASVLSGEAGGDDPEDVDLERMTAPEALQWVIEEEKRIEAFVRVTPYLQTEVNGEHGVEKVHPLSFAIGNLRRIKGALFQIYGVEMWQHSRDEAGKMVDLVDHPHDDWRGDG